MCATCGCSDDAGVRVTDHDHDHPHDHGHGHTIVLEQKVLAHNDELAERNRAWFAEHDILAINLMSSPGSGKTTLLERTIGSVPGPVAVVEGDQETLFDADRIRAAGCPVVQVNTGAGCHLDATMLDAAVRTLEPAAGSTLFIENVGNLVCPALFDLGESSRVVVVSTTEGADKPRKYPHMFAAADLVLLNKVDLLPYVDFSVEDFTRHVAAVNPTARILPISATRGDGMAAWYSWCSSTVD
jgi:hydrogenase nickel incorporation protein HypB